MVQAEWNLYLLWQNASKKKNGIAATYMDDGLHSKRITLIKQIKNKFTYDT